MDTKQKDIELWDAYKRTKSPQDLEALFAKFKPLMMSQVNKWQGNLPKDVLLNEAMVLAKKAFDSYNKSKGVALSTHVVNGLQPLSRVVYTYQNTARLPENITLKMQTYNSAHTDLTSMYGREPSTDELHQSLGWSAKAITRLQEYNRRGLLESAGGVSGDFYQGNDSSDDTIEAIYTDLLPEEKKLLEYSTGLHRSAALKNKDIMDRMGWSQAQLSYKKSLLTKKLKALS